jgi:RNA polymerase-binding transcription factor DksA
METDLPHELLWNERIITIARIASMATEFDDIVMNSPESNLDDEHDPEGSTIAFERARIGALLKEARDALGAVDAALAKISGGKYGSCERCEATISPERLVALPTARLCINCATILDLTHPPMLPAPPHST